MRQISVIVHPNGRKKTVETDLLNNLHVYVSQPPLEGRANKAVIETLAKYFSVNKNQIVFLKGLKTKKKIFGIL